MEQLRQLDEETKISGCIGSMAYLGVAELNRVRYVRLWSSSGTVPTRVSDAAQGTLGGDTVLSKPIIGKKGINWIMVAMADAEDLPNIVNGVKDRLTE